MLTQIVFLCPLHSDQQIWGEGGSTLRTLCISSGSDSRCLNGSRCAARQLFSKYLCTVETTLAAWVVRGVLSGWDGINLVRGVLSDWVEMNLDDDERSDRCPRKSGHSLRAVVVRGRIVFRGIIIVAWTTVIIVGGSSSSWIIPTTTLREDGRVTERPNIGTTKRMNPPQIAIVQKTQLALSNLKQFGIILRHHLPQRLYNLHFRHRTNPLLLRFH